MTDTLSYSPVAHRASEKSFITVAWTIKGRGALRSLFKSAADLLPALHTVNCQKTKRLVGRRRINYGSYLDDPVCGKTAKFRVLPNYVFISGDINAKRAIASDIRVQPLHIR